MAKKKRSPLRPLIALAVMILIAAASLGIGAATSRTQIVPELALDLQGGTQLILTPTVQEGAANTTVSEDDLAQAIEVIRKRVDASGVSESEITSQGGRNITVSLPGEPSEETLNLVRSSAVMVFRPVLSAAGGTSLTQAILASSQTAESNATESDASAEPSTTQSSNAEPSQPTASATAKAEDNEVATPSPTPLTEAEAKANAEQTAMQMADKNQDGQLSDEPTAQPTDASDPNWITEKLTYDFLMADCTDPAMRARGPIDDNTKPMVACSQEGNEKYILGPVEIEGKHLVHAVAGQAVNSSGQPTGQWVVNIEFDGEGTKSFAALSERLYDLQSTDHVRSRFAAVLDGNVVSAPNMNAIISNGKAEISGNFTASSSRALANQLQFGSLPLNFTVESERSISATLGADHLAKGLWAGLIGLALVVLYLIWQYRGLAIIAAGSLVVAAIIVYLSIALLSWGMGYRLSLAGVAGLVIAIGITADSFIVYFERVRDEVRSGQPLRAAVHTGWQRAARTIVVSDMVNLLAAIVLYFLAVGGVQGFAFTLGLTTVVDLIVILMFTHPMLLLLIRSDFFGGGHRWSGLDPEHLGARSSAVYAGRGRVNLPGTETPRTERKNASGGSPQFTGETIAQRRQREAAEAKAATSVPSTPAAQSNSSASDTTKEEQR